MGIDMAIRLIEESEMIIEDGKKGKRYAKNDRRFEVASPIVCTTDKSITILAADKIIKCERRELGTTSNCAICEGIAREMFERCKHKWTDY